MGRVTTEDLDEIRSVGFFPARRTVKPSLHIMAAIEFRIGPEMDFFRFFLARTEIFSA